MVFLRDSLCLSAVTLSRQRRNILDFGHHHLSEDMDISRPAEYFIACYTVLMRPNKVETALSTVAIIGFQFGLYHVVAPLSFLRSISLASLFVTFYFWLIRSFTDPAFTGSIFVCSPLHHHVSVLRLVI